jgi:hypothetical protein
MISLGVLSYLCYAVSVTAISSEVTASNERTIEILIAGPKDARNRMARAIRPLFGNDADVRWATEEQLPTDRSLPEPGQQGAAQIWIDVSNPIRLRVYLPAIETKGATTVRTLTRAGTTSEESDRLAREAVAQIVKTAVLTLRRGPAEPAEALTTPAGESSEAAVSQQPALRRSDNSWQGAHEHDGFYMRISAGYGKLAAADANEHQQYSKFGPTINVAVGGTIVPNLILYGELLMTGVVNANERIAGDYYPASNTGRDLILYGFGPGIAYYFMPMNVYVSGTLALTKITFIDAYTDEPAPDTDMGYGGSFTVGKEWWGNRDWGVGIAGQFNYARSMKHPFHSSYADDDSELHVTTFSLLFSATYN